MSGIGSSEFILLLVIGLIVLGPKRLPEVANKIGGWVGQARRMTRVMKRQLEDELNLDEHRNLLPPSNPFETPDPAPNRPKEKELAAEGDPKPVAEEAPATEADDTEPAEVENHIPNDDDTFSPLHGDEAESVVEEGAPKEQKA